MEPVSATYHVFINHRGPDVKKTLASLIYHRLTTCHGLRVFLDQKELHTGDGLSPAIRGAIESASVHVAIFSERYAESRWCLDELCWILRCNRKIIPVFCDVEPTDLRYIDSESGRYREAFEEHQRKGRVTMEDIQKWKTALGTASEISGVPFKTNESDFGEVVEKIVKAVLKGVKWEPLEVAKYLVGLDPAVKEITDEIKKQGELNGTAIVGIAGMAGVGKSTLAAYLYNMKRSDFSRSCFLSEVRKKDLTSLQRKLLRDLLGCDFDIEDTRQGKGIFRDRLRGLQVLIVLDDADDIKQINSLLVTDVLGSRSLILITSRDQDLLTRFSQKTAVYKVKPLQGRYAHELFCWHAFHQSQPYEGFEHLVEKALQICGGLPLTLQVLGGQFLGRHEKQFWEQQLEMFPRNPPRDIIDTLTVSYKALSPEEQEIFLDIGCFFVGEEKEVAVGVIEGLGYNYNDICACLENLRHKCLVEYHDEAQCDYYENKSGSKKYRNLSLRDSNSKYDYLNLTKRDKITMHDQFRHLARRIAREEFGALPTPKPARLSCSSDIEELMLKLQGRADSCLIRGIRTPKGQNLPDRTNYIKGVGVRLFAVEFPIDLSSLFGLWDISGDLVWLRLRSFTSICFPDTISMRNLRVLELQGHGDPDQFFQRFDEPPQNLNVLNITITDTHRASTSSSSQLFDRKGFMSSSSRSPSLDSAQKDFTASSFFRFLKWIGTSIKSPWKIVLKNITFLESLPIDFLELKSLTHLDLSGCTDLTHLPNSFSELMHLQFLALRDCNKLSFPMNILGNMSSLEYADFKGCSKLKCLPTGMANQRSLKYLNVLATDLKLPITLELPDRLEQLRIGNTLRVPLSIAFGSTSGSVGKEVQTHMSGSQLRPLGDLRRLEDLKELILIGLDGLKRILWEEIAGPNIKLLVIASCPIDNITFKNPGTMRVKMSVLRDLTLSRTLITEICFPEGVFPSLETLDLSGNRKLMQVKGLPSTLVTLNLEGCSELTEVEDLPSTLVSLNLQGCNELTEVEDLPSTLVSLNLQRCQRLKILNLSNLVDLKFLSVNQCFLDILNVEGLTSLEEIQAEECLDLRNIQGLTQLERLKCLRISTDTDVIWNDICNFLTSTFREKLSTAFFSGKLGKSSMNTASYEMAMQKTYSIAGEFNLKVVDVKLAVDVNVYQSSFHTKMEEFQSYGAILMCFLVTAPLRGVHFRVRFEASNDGGSADEYKILLGMSFTIEAKLHVFMWAEECDMFRDCKGYNNIYVTCNLSPEEVKRGWIMMVDKDTDVSQVFKQIINAAL